MSVPSRALQEEHIMSVKRSSKMWAILTSGVKHLRSGAPRELSQTVTYDILVYKQTCQNN